MILTPEEQIEYREEIDYAIETHGYEYVWGKETTMDKTKGLLRNAPGKILDSINKIVTNPTVIDINEKLKAHSQRINAQDSEHDFVNDYKNPAPMNTRRTPQRKQPSVKNKNPLDKEFDFGDDHL